MRIMPGDTTAEMSVMVTDNLTVDNNVSEDPELKPIDLIFTHIRRLHTRHNF